MADSESYCIIQVLIKLTKLSMLKTPLQDTQSHIKHLYTFYRAYKLSIY